MTRRNFVAAFATLLPGCASVDVADYRGQKPEFDLARFFNGTVVGWGMIEDRTGKVLRRFTALIEGTWVGNDGTLDEVLTYTDGVEERRVWKFVRNGSQYSGTAGDVVGTAQGETQGNALHLRYVLAVPIDGVTWNLDMDDRMYLVDERTVLNRTRMSKLGVRVGELTAAFQRR